VSTAHALSDASSILVRSGNYYVDAEAGNDKNNGQSEQTAWKTLEKVNGHTFQPGDRILLKSGSVWIGQLKPKGSGTAAAPIRVDQYGKGLLKPLIVGNGIVAQGVVLLHNQSYWEISNLEITNDAATNAERRGVEIGASNYGIVEHIYLKNLIIHDIKGTVGNKDSDKKSSGIYFGVIDDKIKATRFNDILVEGCLIYNCQNEGIVTANEIKVSDYPGSPGWERRKFTNLIFRNNVIHHISKNAMIIRLAEGGLVERNLCYETATGTQGNTLFSRSCRGTVFQYNEGFLNRSATADGSLYDPDINSPGTIWQYSYSHDNSHGLVWFCTDERDDNIIVRYNVSKNDRGNIVYFNYPFKSASVHNNVFYIGEGLSPALIREKGSTHHQYTYTNNIIYNSSKTARFVLAPPNSKGVQVRDVSKNIFYNVPAEPLISKSLNDYRDTSMVTFHPESRDHISKLPFVALNAIGYVNGLPVTAEELSREMSKLRYQTLRSGTAEIDQTVLKNKALQVLVPLKVQEKMLKDRQLWPFVHYGEVNPYMQRVNALRKEKAANGEVVYGPAEFSEPVYFDYRFSNAVIELKHRLIAEQLITITEDRLLAQFKKMQQTVYAEEKFTFNNTYPQLREAYIEACYAEIIAAGVKKAALKMN